jgi:hypothetical protein
MDYKEIIKERLGLLSPELRAFVLDENWRREAEKIGKQFNLNEEKYASFENEVFLVLLCFENKSDFTENIKKGLEIDTNMAGWMAEDVEKNIFSKIAKQIDLMWQIATTESDEGPEQSGAEEESDQNQNNVGNDFEQIILNQAKAMQPAREAPTNLPIGNVNTEEKQKAIHNYVPGSDPYREPLE